jgi:hypothetical protein
VERNVHLSISRVSTQIPERKCRREALKASSKARFLGDSKQFTGKGSHWRALGETTRVRTR